MVSRETSPLREAIRAALFNAPTIVDVHSDDWDALVDHLAAAVEAVPVKVTIRDLILDGPENVITLPMRTADYLRWAAGEASRLGVPLHLTVDEGYLKVKIANASWSPPLTTKEYTG